MSLFETLHRVAQMASNKGMQQQVAIREATKLLEEAGVVGETLTRREIEVLQKSAEGLTYSEIGDDQSIILSPRTVDTHLGNVYRRKLQVHTRLGAVIAAYNGGLLDIPKIISGLDIASVDTLSPREKEVMEETISQYRNPSNEQIARALGIGIRTIDAHKSNIRGKTKARNFISATILYMEAKKQKGEISSTVSAC